MATAFTPFATVADLAAALGVAAPTVGSVAHSQMLDALSDASDDLRDIVGQPINRGTTTVTVWAKPGGVVRLPAVPIVSVASVASDGEAVEFEVLDSSSLSVVTSAPLKLTITYTHGWLVVPGIFRKWCKVLAAASLAAAKSGNLGLSGGLAGVSVDDGRVSWATAAGENGGGVSLPEAVALRLRSSYGSPYVTLEQG